MYSKIKAQTAQSDIGVMEPKTILKNGASPKSQMSRELFFSFIKRYKFTIFVFVYFLLIVYFQRGLGKTSVTGVLSIMLLLHLIGKSGKFSLLLNVFLSLLITLDAFYGFIFRQSVSSGIVAAIIGTDSAEAMSVMKEYWLKILSFFVLSFSLIYASAGELQKV